MSNLNVMFSKKGDHWETPKYIHDNPELLKGKEEK